MIDDRFTDDIDMLTSARGEKTRPRSGSDYQSSVGAVVKIHYADTSDHRASTVGGIDTLNYGAPTVDVFLPYSRQTLRKVKVLQHGSARQNVSIWTPTLSTHILEGDTLYVPEIDERTGLTIEPLKYKRPGAISDFDGDHVIVQSIHMGAGDYDYFVIGTVPFALPSRERLHYAPRSRQAADVRIYNQNYTPADTEQSDSNSMSVRANRLSALDYTHPLLGVRSDGSSPDISAADGDEMIEQTNEGKPDRLLSNPVGEERYLAHNGSVARIDQQGNVLLDTTLAGIKNNRMDIEAAAAFGDAGHIDINLNKRLGQGITVRVGGEVVFSIRHQGDTDIVSLGAELAEAFSSVLGERLAAVFDNHQHMTVQGPTTVPLPVQDPLTAGAFPDVPPVGTMTPSNIGSANESEAHAVITDKVIIRS
jgi:hypothetical protein